MLHTEKTPKDTERTHTNCGRLFKGLEQVAGADSPRGAVSGDRIYHHVETQLLLLFCFFLFLLLWRQSGKDGDGIRGFEDRFASVQAQTGEGPNKEFPPGEGRQTETTLSAAKNGSVLSHMDGKRRIGGACFHRHRGNREETQQRADSGAGGSLLSGHPHRLIWSYQVCYPDGRQSKPGRGRTPDAHSPGGGALRNQQRQRERERKRTVKRR